MPIDDEMLMAFADGALTGPEAETIARAVAADPLLAEKLAQHRQLREMLSDAFAPVLDEPVPAALLQATVSRAPAAPVADIAAARERRDGRRAAFVQRWGSIAAALAVGLFAGHLADFSGGLVKQKDGTLYAKTTLSIALDDQLASEDPAVRSSPVRIGITFRNQADQYCRTFSAARENSLSGIACRHKGKWEIRMAAAANAVQGESGYRMAGSDTAIMEAAQAMMKGEPFDAATEARARAKTWKDGQHIN